MLNYLHLMRFLSNNILILCGFNKALRQAIINCSGGFMRTTKELLGERIKELRKAKKLSQDKLSEQIGIDPKHLSRIEVGSSYPSLSTLEKIAIALHVDIKEFFEFEHLSGQKELINNAIKLLKETDEEKIKLITKVIKAIIN